MGRLVFELQLVAYASNESLPTPASLKTMISRWERDWKVPDLRNRRLLCRALGISEADLGLSADPDLDQ